MTDSRGESRALLLAGPTAVGKTEVALFLAERLGGEIISVDSMQVYRGLDIGTAKSTLTDLSRVPHHLINVVDLTTLFSAADFVRLANEALARIRARGRIPILCGGTGLYFSAFLKGLGQAPARDPTLRAELEARPLSELLTELADSDPEAYEKIDRKNPRRVVRAIEIRRLSGQPVSSQRANWSNPELPAVNAMFGLTRAAEDLRSRIGARVDEMFRRGLVEETERLLKAGLAQNLTARQALGYRQVVEHLRSERSLRETIELVKTRTRQFAKRQMTWFRNQLPIEWLHLASDASPAATAKEIESLWQRE